jgi:hypothetical protein
VHPPWFIYRILVGDRDDVLLQRLLKPCRNVRYSYRSRKPLGNAEHRRSGEGETSE